MTETNRIVPFPSSEVLNPISSDLESFVLNSAEGRLPNPDQLGSNLHATGIEVYANWLSALTLKDSTHRERGAVLHVEVGNKKIVFPTNPDVGKEDACGWAVSRKRDKFIPTIEVHSHQQNLSFSGNDFFGNDFSGYGGDMTTFLSGWGEGLDYFIPTGMLVATPEFNYLIVKTNKTPPVVDKSEAYENGWTDSGTKELFNLIRLGYVSRLDKELTAADHLKLFKQAEQNNFHGDFEGFYRSFVIPLNLSEVYSLGFYYSVKDGQFIRFTKEGVNQFITKQLDKALNQAQSSVKSRV